MRTMLFTLSVVLLIACMLTGCATTNGPVSPDPDNPLSAAPGHRTLPRFVVDGDHTD